MGKPEKPQQPRSFTSRLLYPFYLFFAGAYYILFGWLWNLVFRRQNRRHEVIIYQYPPLLFAWPIIAAGFLFWPLHEWELIPSEILAWVYGITLVVIIITLGTDLDILASAFIIVCLIAGVLSVLLLGYQFEVGFFASIYQFLDGLELQYPALLSLLISVALSVPFCIMIASARINDKWRITHNEFDHYKFMRRANSLARGAKTTQTRYPDLLEFLLCLAGDLYIKDSRGRQTLACIKHVPWLPFRRRKIDWILESTSVTLDTAAQEEREEEETDGLEYAEDGLEDGSSVTDEPEDLSPYHR